MQTQNTEMRLPQYFLARSPGQGDELRCHRLIICGLKSMIVGIRERLQYPDQSLLIISIHYGGLWIPLEVALVGFLLPPETRSSEGSRSPEDLVVRFQQWRFSTLSPQFHD